MARHPRAASGIPDLRAVVPALAEHATSLRHRLNEWANSAGLASELVEAMSLAVYEAMANAVEHAYRGRAPGDLRMAAVLAYAPDGPGRVVVTVEDDGRWHPPETGPDLRGRGIPLMRALAGLVDISPAAEGTSVRMTWQADAFSAEDTASRSAARPGDHA